MHTNNESEIVFVEKYGSSSTQRYYVKPPDQNSIVSVDTARSSEVKNVFATIFLPQGYPDSVSKDYINYQIWDTAQAFCSTITGILATQEVFRGVGVGDTSATPLAATVTWVLRDGCGHLGKILFAYTHGTYLDAYSKKWRLYADALNDAAMCVEMALPLYSAYAAPALCASAVMRALVGVAGGATRAAMTQHHAVRGNMADVAAKDSAQETAVNLVASLAALAIITVFGNSILIFILMMILHIVFNYFAVRAVCLRTLNEPRFLQVIANYLKSEVISSPCEINKSEPIIFYQIGMNVLDSKICGFHIELGCSIKQFSRRLQAEGMITLKRVYNKRKYLLVPDVTSRWMYVLIASEASTDDVMCAYFHAVLLSVIICSINDYKLDVYSSTAKATRPFAQVCEAVRGAAWSRAGEGEGEWERVGEWESPHPHQPSTQLAEYVDGIVHKEWKRVANGLAAVGWDLSKHLLLTDEWRLCQTSTCQDGTDAPSLDVARRTAGGGEGEKETEMFDIPANSKRKDD